VLPDSRAEWTGPLLDAWLTTRNCTRPTRVHDKIALVDKVLAAEAEQLRRDPSHYVRLHDESGASMFEIMRAELADAHLVCEDAGDEHAPYAPPPFTDGSWTHGLLADTAHTLPTIERMVLRHHVRRCGKRGDWTAAAEADCHKTMNTAVRRIAKHPPPNFRWRRISCRVGSVPDGATMDSDLPAAPTQEIWQFGMSIARSRNVTPYDVVVVLLVDAGGLEKPRAAVEPSTEPLSTSTAVEVIKMYCPCRDGAGGCCGHGIAAMLALNLATVAIKALARGATVDTLKTASEATRTALLCRWIVPTHGDTADITEPTPRHTFHKMEGSGSTKQSVSANSASTMRHLYDGDAQNGPIDTECPEWEDAVTKLITALRADNGGEPSAFEAQWHPEIFRAGSMQSAAVAHNGSSVGPVTPNMRGRNTKATTWVGKKVPGKKRSKTATAPKTSKHRRGRPSAKSDVIADDLHPHPDPRTVAAFVTGVRGMCEYDGGPVSLQSLLSAVKSVTDLKHQSMSELRALFQHCCKRGLILEANGRVEQRKNKRVLVPQFLCTDTAWFTDWDLHQAQVHGDVLARARANYRGGRNFDGMQCYPGYVRLLTAQVECYASGHASANSTMRRIFEGHEYAAWVFNAAWTGSGTHWLVLLLDGRPSRRYVGFWDPLGGMCPRPLKLQLIAAMERSGEEWITEFQLAAIGSYPLQSDGYECGPWGLVAEECWAEYHNCNVTDVSFGTWVHAKFDELGLGCHVRRRRWIAEHRHRFRGYACEEERGDRDVDAIVAAIDDDAIPQSVIAASLKYQ
jgi:hypothetical protein